MLKKQPIPPIYTEIIIQAKEVSQLFGRRVRKEALIMAMLVVLYVASAFRVEWT